MSEPGGHNLRWNTSRQADRGIRMAQVVKSDSGYTDACELPFEQLTDRLGM